MGLIRASRIAGVLSKEAASVPGLPGLAGEGGALLLKANPAGIEGRLQNLAAPRAKLKHMQAPRAYAPRLGPPSP
jgi:hypothetical protein